MQCLCPAALGPCQPGEWQGLNSTNTPRPPSGLRASWRGPRWVYCRRVGADRGGGRWGTGGRQVYGSGPGANRASSSSSPPYLTLGLTHLAHCRPVIQGPYGTAVWNPTRSFSCHRAGFGSSRASRPYLRLPSVKTQFVVSFRSTMYINHNEVELHVIFKCDLCLSQFFHCSEGLMHMFVSLRFYNN